jgi:hypothetical protein
MRECQQYIEYIQDVLISFHENIRELRDRKGFADAEELTHIEAKIIAYEEALAIMRMSAEDFNIPKNEIGM